MSYKNGTTIFVIFLTLLAFCTPMIAHLAKSDRFPLWWCFYLIGILALFTARMVWMTGRSLDPMLDGQQEEAVE